MRRTCGSNIMGGNREFSFCFLIATSIFRVKDWRFVMDRNVLSDREKGRYRYAGQWKHGRMHGCGIYELNEHQIYVSTLNAPTSSLVS